MRSALLSLLILGAPLAAQQVNPFTDLVHTAQASFPGKQHVGVICDYGFSRGEVQQLADALGTGRITVVDIKTRDQAGAAAGVLRKAGAELMVLLPRDRFVYDGAPHATLAAWRLAGAMPLVGTHPRALENGAAFAIGEATGHELLVNERLRGIIGPVTAPAKVARTGGSAQIAVLTAR